jgi:hypothetical protein
MTREQIKTDVANTFKSMNAVERLIVNLVIDHLADNGMLVGVRKDNA